MANNLSKLGHKLFNKDTNYVYVRAAMNNNFESELWKVDLLNPAFVCIEYVNLTHLKLSSPIRIWCVVAFLVATIPPSSATKMQTDPSQTVHCVVPTAVFCPEGAIPVLNPHNQREVTAPVSMYVPTFTPIALIFLVKHCCSGTPVGVEAFDVCRVYTLYCWSTGIYRAATHRRTRGKNARHNSSAYLGCWPCQSSTEMYSGETCSRAVCAVVLIVVAC